MLVALFALLLVAAAPLADTPLPDPRQEEQARSLMQELRCLVCQHQSIADSDAEMAGDMRALVRERIAAGETPDQVRDYLVSRYGDWVTFAPPMRGANWVLWTAPPLFLGIGALVAFRLFKRRAAR